MDKLIKWFDTPLKRLGSGFLLIAAGAFLGYLFVPLSLVSFCGYFLLFMMGQSQEEQWLEGNAMQCPVCKEESVMLLVERKTHMCPFLPGLNKLFSIYLSSEYFLVCNECLQTHVGKQDLSTTMIIAAGGLAHAKSITREEFEAMKK